MVFTDGVVDIENAIGEAFGSQQLIETIAQNKVLTSQELIHHVVEQTRVFAGFQPYQDDFTLVIVERNQ